ncbi:MAG: amidohydrolase family protein [Oscillospiraceae bacterium]|nr:amidohydrolase family protein [Oscillospiraceae bacterium]
MQNELLLRDYDPVSMQQTPTTEVLTPKSPVFDAHIHIGKLQMGDDDYPVDVGAMVNYLKQSGVVGVVNLKMFWGKPLEEHLESLKGYEDYIHTFASADVTRLEEPDFAAYIDDLFKQFKSMGIRGLKFWKNIGCTLKDSENAYIRPDDSRLRPVWDAAAKYGLLVLYHIADPVSFFTPVDKHNEFYESLCEHPDWSFYGDNRYSFEELMIQQDALLSQNPDTTFVIPHTGSYTENLAWVGAQLDKHPNMYIDTAARNNLLGRQPYTARDFIIRYQDRILFGTDYFGGADKVETEEFYADHYRFFETYDEYFPAYRSWGTGQGRWNVYGLGLPDEVLKKFYYENAMKLINK